MRKDFLFGLSLCVLANMSGVIAANAAPKKFIPTFFVQYAPIIPGDELALGKFDLLDLDRSMYDDVAVGQYPTSWAAIRAVNPQTQIYLYQMGPEASNYHDTQLPQYLNGLGRYDVSRGHTMGSLNGNNPGLFLLDAAGQRSYNMAYSTPANNQYWYLMDFGNSLYRSYWIEATVADIVAQSWVADGIFVDNAVALNWGGYAAPVNYPTNASWSSAMNAFVGDITTGLHNNAQKAWFNRGQTVSADGYNAWLALDGSATPPDVIMEEGAFAVSWGSGVTQFYPEVNWRRQVDIMGAVKNSKITFLSHTKLDRDQNGLDNWGKPVTFWQTLWYSMSSFLLGKNAQLDNAYFMFLGDATTYNRIWWFDEYEKIDLGDPVGPYTVARVNTINEVGGTREVNVYSREFTRGYVYVTSADPAAFTTDSWATWAYRSEVATISLPQATKKLTHETLTIPIVDLPTVSTVNLASHQGAILLKVADLAVTVTGTPNPVLLGSMITYNVSVTNNGPSTASAIALSGLTGCILSSSAIPSGGTTSCSISVPATMVGAVSQTVSVSAAEFDPNTINNTVLVTTAVNAPDLVATTVSANKSDNRVYVSDTVVNRGNGDAGAFTIGYYLSTDTNYSSNDLALVSGKNGTTPCTRTVTALGPAATSGITSKACYKPAGVATRVRYFVLVVDDVASRVIESNETNNTRSTTETLRW